MFKNMSDARLDEVATWLRQSRDSCTHDAGLAKQLHKSIESHEVELQARMHEKANPPGPPTLSDTARRLGRQLGDTGRKLRKKEGQLADQQAQLAKLQQDIETTKQGIAALSDKLQALQNQADKATEAADAAPVASALSPDCLFLDRVLELLRHEGREEGTWEGIMDRLKQLRTEAQHVQEVAAKDVQAARDERKWARRAGRAHPVFSAVHSSDVVTYHMDSGDEATSENRETAEEWGSATDTEAPAIVTEVSSDEATPSQPYKRARGMPSALQPLG